ncbi:hypothetical protein [Amycolatopsis thermoflava]|uniref:hypothetical protein n=1 Tax=Amycolatopsis thermoflava TaxID=84480 RepID=UPI0037F8FDD0
MRNTVVTQLTGNCLLDSSALTGWISRSVAGCTRTSRTRKSAPKRRQGAVIQTRRRDIRAQAVTGAVTDRVTRAGRCEVADLLYAVLLIAVFAVLALTLRGLEKL